MIAIALRANALRNGFAAATTNTGHDAIREPLGTFTVDRAKLIDYAFRAVHLTAQNAKRIAARYYGRPPAYSYWDGCSTCSMPWSDGSAAVFRRFRRYYRRRAGAQPWLTRW